MEVDGHIMSYFVQMRKIQRYLSLSTHDICDVFEVLSAYHICTAGVWSWL